MSSSGNLIVERQGTAKPAGGPALARARPASRRRLFFPGPLFPGGGPFLFLCVLVLFLLLFLLFLLFLFLLFPFVLFFPAVFPPCLSQPF